jgi:hypothetical protein
MEPRVLSHDAPDKGESNMSTKGTVIAAMVAGLFASAAPLAAQAKAEGKVHCEGANACKGKSACKTASSGCAGQNACQGKGWIETANEKECKAKGGKVVAPAK